LISLTHTHTHSLTLTHTHSLPLSLSFTLSLTFRTESAKQEAKAKKTSDLDTAAAPGSSSDDPSSPSTKVKTWLKTRLAIRKDGDDDDTAPEQKQFLGGRALADSRIKEPSSRESSTLQPVRPAPPQINSATTLFFDAREQQPKAVSPVSGLGPVTPGEQIGDPMAKLASQTSPPRDSRFREIFEE